MKIAYLSAGISVRDQRFLSKMLERGHKPYLISFWGSEVNFSMPGVEFFDYRPRYLSKIKKVIFLRKLLNKIQPDIVHTGFLPTHGLIGAFLRGFPVLSNPWGSDVLVLPQKSLYYRLIANFVLKRAAMISCDCEYVKTKILELSNCDPAKIRIVPCGIDLNVFRPKYSEMRQNLGWENNKILIMTRQFKPIYGIEYFINALSHVIEKVPEVRIVLGGQGPLESEIRKRVKGYGLEKYIYFAGFVNEKIMAEYLNSSDVYVSTSLSDGSSLSLLESMACRLPVVVSDVPANREWIKDGVNGFVVPIQDSVLLAEKLIELLRNPLLCQKMGNQNYDVANEKANWDENFIKFEEMYKQICQEYSQ